jgi:hypothetical protein
VINLILGKNQSRYSPAAVTLTAHPKEYNSAHPGLPQLGVSVGRPELKIED